MKISAKFNYACRALLELSYHWPNPDPLSNIEISRRQKIPLKFLTQIFLVLKQAGFVESVRGKGGGYALTRSPREITLGGLIRHFPELSYGGPTRKDPQSSAHVLEPIWQEFDRLVSDHAERITFEDILNKDCAAQNIAVYTI
jgi:Rrf2 family protein